MRRIFISTPGNIQVVRCGTVLTIFDEVIPENFLSGCFSHLSGLTAGLTTDYCEARLLCGRGHWWLDNM